MWTDIPDPHSAARRARHRRDRHHRRGGGGRQRGVQRHRQARARPADHPGQAVVRPTMEAEMRNMLSLPATSIVPGRQEVRPDVRSDLQGADQSAHLIIQVLGAGRGQAVRAADFRRCRVDGAYAKRSAASTPPSRICSASAALDTARASWSVPTMRAKMAVARRPLVAEPASGSSAASAET